MVYWLCAVGCTLFWTFATGGFWLPSSSLVILQDEPVDDVQIGAFGLEVVSSPLDKLQDVINGMRIGILALTQACCHCCWVGPLPSSFLYCLSPHFVWHK